MVQSQQTTKKQNIETGIVFALVLILVHLKWEYVPGLWFSAGLLLVAILMPTLLFPLAYIWFGLARIISWFSARLILIILYLFLVTPVALIRRAMGKDSLRLNAFKKNTNSAFIPRNNRITEADLKYPF
jgi:uncharacterized membrane protein